MAKKTEKKKERTVALKTEEITTILGKGSEFEGKLQFEGTLRIEGAYSGQIISDSVLVVGEGAKVEAEIDIGTIVINGEVKGNIRAKQGVEIRHPGRLLGNLETPMLTIEKGVIFEGSCRMENLGKKEPAFKPPPVEQKDKDKKE
ncbi:MAG: polymer-forming cytoskeletal protein [Deltaproteobacteria bacterium]|nr:polymer-forming cytoskeletal protein [Deltaproteobacteria bacterium]